MYPQRAIVVDALAVLRTCGLADGHAGPPRGIEARDEGALIEAVGHAIAAMDTEQWERLNHQQRQVLLVAQATIRHYPLTTDGSARAAGWL